MKDEVGGIDRALERLYAETLASFHREFRLYLETAAEIGGEADETRLQRMRDLLYSITNTFEIVLKLSEVGPAGEELLCPYSARGLDAYRARYEISAERWRRVENFFSAMSRMLGEDVMDHLQRQLSLPCRDCNVKYPLKAIDVG